MARLATLPLRLATMKPKLAELGRPEQGAENYGKGRGGRPWRRFRQRVLERDAHLCQPCEREKRLTAATEVDHIVPLSQGGADMDEDNAQAICTDCHKAKTAREASRTQRW